MKIVKKYLSIVLFVSLCLAEMASAAPQKEGIGREQAIAIVKQRFEGKVLKVQHKKNSKASFYKVKVLTESGRVRVLRVDSQSGKLLNASKP